MTAKDIRRWLVERAKSFGVLVASALLTFFVLNGELFGSDHHHIKGAVAAELRDPSSAQFREIFGQGETQCGEVNARNGLGGYSGFRGFVHHRGIVLFEPELSAGATVSEQADHYEALARFARIQARCHGPSQGEGAGEIANND